MKKTRRIAAFIAAMAMAATLAVPFSMTASAEDEVTVPVTVVTNGSTANEVTQKTPNEDQAVHTYTAYQIFKGEYDSNTQAFMITGIGNGVNATNLFADNSAFMKFRKDPASESVGEKIAKLVDANSAATNDDKAKAAAQAISGITDDSAAAQELAKILANFKTTGTQLTKEGNSNPSELNEGYYFVEDTYTVNATNDAVSRFILRVNSAENQGGIKIVPKKSYPEAIKKVQENQQAVLEDWVNVDPTTLEDKVNTSDKWNDTADYCIGDAVPFQLYGSMPATLDDYSAYYYKFTDTLATQFNKPKEVNVKVDVATGTDIELKFKLNTDGTGYEIDGDNYYKGRAATEASYEFGSAKAKELLENALAENTDYINAATDAAKAAYVHSHWSALIAEGGALENATTKTESDWIKTIPAKTEITVEDNTTDGNCRVVWNNGQLVVEFEDIKAYAGVDKDTIVTVNYTAVLNENAVIGLDGQENKVDLTYSNNPNVEYNPDTTDNTAPNINTIPDTDKTPEDTVVVFTYEVDVTKVDNITKDALAGAKFILKDKDGKMAVLDNGKVTDWIGGATAAAATEGADKGKVTFTGTKTSKNHAGETGYTVPDPTVIETPANGKFNIIGLDAGEYTLTELVAPEGYVLPSDTDFALTVLPKGKVADATNATDYIVHTQKYKTEADYTSAATVLASITGELEGEAMTEKADGKHGTLEGTIANSNVSTLPSTGGMGTILFYTVGGILVIGAGVVLVTKKRSKNEQ